jgi:hypothetical protein
MNQYYVYSRSPEKLNAIGKVHYPKINMSYVILETPKELHEVRCVEGVYDARMCEASKVGIIQ